MTPPLTQRNPLPAPLLFALIFSAVWLLHAPLLRLPYFWDEAGYFVPAARDLLLTGDPVPASTLSNAHPPLVMAWLAFWWRFSAYTPAVTRTAMLLVAAFTLTGVFRLARQVSNLQVAVAATALTAVYPVFFAQSSLGHLDMMAAGFTIWALASYLRGNRWYAIGLFALAGMAKETALIAPFALLAWEAFGRLNLRLWESQVAFCGHNWWRTLALALPCVPLAGWLAYHYFRTGIVFGNPEYFRYNVGATLHPVRFVLALAQRFWQLFGYLNMFVLTTAAALAMRRAPVPINGQSSEEADERPRIEVSVQLVFGVVILAYLVALSVVGGAVLARYLLPVYPLVILEAVATLWRRLRWWTVAAGVVAAAFVAGLLAYPPYRFAPEDNLAYADFVRLHKQAAVWLAKRPQPPRVLTAWPASDELQKTYLGYVKRPIEVVPVEDFTSQQLSGGAAGRQFDYALIFPTKYEPPTRMPRWWERLQVRYFDYHHDVPPEEAARILGGRIIYLDQRGGEWVAIIAPNAN
ncbi:MAG: glycosyltransferase [Terriglobales bacterium]